MNHEFVTDEDIDKTTTILKESLKKPKIIDQFNALMFSRDIDLDKQILTYLNRGTNNNGIGYWQILFWLIKNGYLLYANCEKRLDARLESLIKYKLIEKLTIQTQNNTPLSERFYRIIK